MSRGQLAAAMVLGMAFGATPAHAQPAQDDFHHLGEINKASIVMLAEIGLVPEPMAAEIARGIAAVVAGQDEPGAARSSDYLDFEARLVEVAGRDASRLHTGRSRQDIGSTFRRLAIRGALLDAYEALLAPRDALLDLASRHTGTIVPAYTHGVQAQPTSLAHYLLAFAAALDRDAERLEEAFARVNRSPLGAAALATSGFPLDRERLAELLGFDGVVENAYDANHVSSVDSKTEVASTLAISALSIGQLMEDVHVQYHDPAPWLVLDRSLTGVSSIMPQKRNPVILATLRRLASTVIGDAQTVFLNAHNTSTGMADYRSPDQLLETLAKAVEMYRTYARVVNGLVVDPARSLAEVDADYATMTEVADTLLRHADVPFRIGHHYASEITEYGRAQGKRPKELTADELRHLYDEAYGEPLPVDVALIQAALDPEQMVASRRGLGGPQIAEVTRMLEAGQHRADASRAGCAILGHAAEAQSGSKAFHPQSALQSASTDAVWMDSSPPEAVLLERGTAGEERRRRLRPDCDGPGVASRRRAASGWAVCCRRPGFRIDVAFCPNRRMVAYPS